MRIPDEITRLLALGGTAYIMSRIGIPNSISNEVVKFFIRDMPRAKVPMQHIKYKVVVDIMGNPIGYYYNQSFISFEEFEAVKRV